MRYRYPSKKINKIGYQSLKLSEELLPSTLLKSSSSVATKGTPPSGAGASGERLIKTKKFFLAEIFGYVIISLLKNIIQYRV